MALAILTFVAYVLPYLAPIKFTILSVLTLIMPLFLIFNVFYFLYWVIQFKKQLLLSALVLLLGTSFITKLYKYEGKILPKSENDFKIMSYNVRLFNLFHWMNNDKVPETVSDFINDQNPDILCIQEYSHANGINLRVYPYKYIYMLGKRIKSGQAIFSKFPIIHSGKILFPNSSNIAIFADIKKGKDTLRVYNIHLQSIRISPEVDGINQDINEINQQKSISMFKRISRAFKAQQQQAELLMNHKKNCHNPLIICGDMNNSAFSYVYRIIQQSLNDTFEEAGKGFGKTYYFKYYPARIDYIFADKKMEVKEFNDFNNFKNSDHFPIMTRLEMKQ